jgi:hypothetical protein
MGQNLWNPQTVFSYFPPDYEAADGLQGPEFGIQSSTTAIARVNFVQALVTTGIARGGEGGGTRLDLSKWAPLAASPASLVSAFDRFSRLEAAMTAPAGDYRALVCVFLAGGNDGDNTVLPYDEYAAGAARPDNLFSHADQQAL